MNKFFLIMAVVLIAVVGCTSPATPLPPEPTLMANPEAVINAAMESWNTGDVEALIALFADDAVAIFPDWGDKERGKEEITAWIEGLVAVNFAIEPESIETDGDTVTVVAKVWADPTRELGIAPLVTTDVYTVQDNKITSQTSTLREESSAKLMAAMVAAESVSVVNMVMDAWNAGDVETLNELFADDAVATFPDWGDKESGAEEIAAWIKGLVSSNFAIEPESIEANGETVTVMASVWADPTRELGIAPLVTTDVYTIQGGKITSQVSTLSEESAANLLTAMASQPSAVVMAFIEAINAGDLEATMAMYHEDFYADLKPTLLPGFRNLTIGKMEDARDWLEDTIGLNLEVEAEILAQQGDTVTSRSQVSSDYLRQLNVAPLLVTEEFKVNDGQIWSWKRTITVNSETKLQEGLAHSGIAATLTPEADEVLAKVPSDILGAWKYTLLGESAVLEFKPDGYFEIRGPGGKVGVRAQFRFEGDMLLLENKDAAVTDYCDSGTGSYVVFVTKAGNKTVTVRFHEILDQCELRSGALTGSLLSPES